MLSLAILCAIVLIYGGEATSVRRRLYIKLSTSCFSRETCDLRIDNNCYVHVDDSVNWNEAEACCVAWGGHLASIHSEGTNHFLNQIRNKDALTWIGLSDTANDGVYVWTDGSAFDYNNFHPNQPHSLGGESCFHFFHERRRELTWNDYNCSKNSWRSVSTSYICQKILRPQMDKSRCDLTQNGKCYIAINTTSTWNAAEDSCVEWGGHLASIHSDLENYAVNSIRGTHDYTWIGLSDTANDGVYVWTDGTAFDYNNFHPGEPNSVNGESCLHFFHEARGELTWNDYHCNRDKAGSIGTSFVCKKDIDTSTTPCIALKGEKGDTGLQGPTGPQNQLGIAGPKGDAGEPGAFGLPGSNGQDGQKGEIGGHGIHGQNGEKGIQGLSGEWGLPGQKGERGVLGQKGEKGIHGQSGEWGLHGEKGERGVRGEKGGKGTHGQKGERGIQGYPEGIDSSRC